VTATAESPELKVSQSAAFVGSIPSTYDRYLGPLIFEDYAADLVRRLAPRSGERVLELACGTGIVTRRLAGALPAGAALTATDLNEAMLQVARGAVAADARVTFQQADACAIPFPNASFNAIVAQFGVMFFPDKLKAMREARRVLAPGGRYLFNVWDSLEHNPIPRIVHETVAARFPANPPNFLKAAPYGYFDRAEIERVVREAGFTSVTCEAVKFPSIAPAAEDAARGFIEGTPLLLGLQERGVQDPAPFRQAAAAALAERFGDQPCVTTMQALVFTAE
jgi:ubiquinone/menaquinone biosynthesis C-methylase UbiE